MSKNTLSTLRKIERKITKLIDIHVGAFGDDGERQRAFNYHDKLMCFIRDEMEKRDEEIGRLRLIERQVMDAPFDNPVVCRKGVGL